MTDFILHELVTAAWLAGLAGSWRMFSRVVLPFALDRCPWGRCP